MKPLSGSANNDQEFFIYGLAHGRRIIQKIFFPADKACLNFSIIRFLFTYYNFAGAVNCYLKMVCQEVTIQSYELYNIKYPSKILL